MASQNNNGSQKSSSVGTGNEASFNENYRIIPLQKSETKKKNNKSSKTSKKNKDDKKQ